MKKLSILTISLLFPLSVFAKESWDLSGDKNTLSISGSCDTQEIKIELYPFGRGESVYTASATCKDKKFQFSDNLLQWNNLKDGKYEVSVNGDTKNIQTITIEKPIIQSSSLQSKKEEKIAIISPQNKFLGAFVSLQQSILDMHTWLDQTSYPKVVKSGIGFGLNGLDLAVGKISALILSGESVDNPIADSKVAASEIESSTGAVMTSEIVKQDEVVQDEQGKTVADTNAEIPATGAGAEQAK